MFDLEDDGRIPSMYRFARFSDPRLVALVKPSSAIEEARVLMQRPGNIVLTGATGSGKSLLAAAMIQEAGQGLYFVWPDFARFVNPENFDDGIARAKKVKVLVIDNFRALYGSGEVPAQRNPPEDEIVESYEVFADRLEEVLWARQKNWRRTVIVTEMDRAEVRESYSIPVAEVIFSGSVLALDPDYDWTKHPPRGDVKHGIKPVCF